MPASESIVIFANGAGGETRFFCASSRNRGDIVQPRQYLPALRLVIRARYGQSLRHRRQRLLEIEIRVPLPSNENVQLPNAHAPGPTPGANDPPAGGPEHPSRSVSSSAHRTLLIERGCYTQEGSSVFARLMIRAIAAAINSRIAVPATKTVTKAMSKAVLA
jgi:hypothetical protein